MICQVFVLVALELFVISDIIASYKRTRSIIEKYGLIVRKNLGQNFLIDNHVLQKIIKSADIGPDDTVIEVGPGIGALTEELCRYAKRVIAIELDSALIPVLEAELSRFGNLTLINGDILKTDLRALICGENSANVKLAANLPYYITTPIVMDILENNPGIESISVMVQKEVGDRMRAVPSTKAYGSLTLAVGYYAEAELIANVPANCFFPRPNVDSCVIRLKTGMKPRVEVKDEDLFFRLIKAAFSKRRKTLVNCLSSYEGLGIDKTTAAEAIVAAGFPEAIRGDALNLESFVCLSDILYDRIQRNTL